MSDGLAIKHDRPQLPRLVDAFGDAIVDDCAEDFDRTRGIPDQLLHAFSDCRRDLIEGNVSVSRFDAMPRHIDVLWGGTHLPCIQRKRKSDVAGDTFKIVDGVDDDLVHACFFGIDLCLMGIAFKPFAVGAAAREVDQLHLWPEREFLCRVVACRMHDQRDNIGIEAATPRSPRARFGR